MKTRLSERDLKNVVRRIVREQEADTQLLNIFKEEGYSNIPDVCKPKTDTSSGVESSDIKGCFEEFAKANEQVMNIANALKSLMDENKITYESLRRRPRY
jgi:hypothetical protein